MRAHTHLYMPEHMCQNLSHKATFTAWPPSMCHPSAHPESLILLRTLCPVPIFQVPSPRAH